MFILHLYPCTLTAFYFFSVNYHSCYLFCCSFVWPLSGSTCKLASVSFFTRSHHFLITSLLSGIKCSRIILNFLLRTGSHFSKEPRGSKVWSQEELLFPGLLSGHTHGCLPLTSPAPSPHVDTLLILLDIYPPSQAPSPPLLPPCQWQTSS